MDIEDVVRGLSAAIECMAIMKNDTQKQKALKTNVFNAFLFDLILSLSLIVGDTLCLGGS